MKKTNIIDNNILEPTAEKGATKIGLYALVTVRN